MAKTHKGKFYISLQRSKIIIEANHNSYHRVLFPLDIYNVTDSGIVEYYCL